MLHNKKLRVGFLTFILLCSLTSVIIFNSIPVKGENTDPDFPEGENPLEYLFLLLNLSGLEKDDVFYPNPYRYVGIWDYEEDKETVIKGKMSFDLYFSSPLLTQISLLNFEDILNISVYSMDFSGSLTLLENGFEEITMQPEFLGDTVQKFSITLDNLDHTLNPGESLVFSIEIIPSQKPLSKIIEPRIKPILIQVTDLLQNSGEPELELLGETLDNYLENLSDVKGEDYADLINALLSSAFYYGSETYNSTVKFKLNTTENRTLCFQNTPSETFLLNYPEIGSIFLNVKNVEKTNVTDVSDHAWPPFGPLIDGEINATEDLLVWVFNWIAYTLQPPKSLDKNIVSFYLHNGNVMNQTYPEGSDTLTQNLRSNAVQWTTTEFERNKIIANISADLYLYYPKILTLKNINIKASLSDEDNTIATDEKVLNGASFTELISRGPSVPLEFNFKDYNENKEYYEIWNGKTLTLSVEITGGLGLSLRPVKLNYDSEQYPSSLTLKLLDTDNIKMDDAEDQNVYAGGSAEYILNVSSNHSDEVSITAEKGTEIGDWVVEYYPHNLSFKANETKAIHVFVNSTSDDISSYDNDEVEIFINASGLTGFATENVIVKITDDAVEHKLEVIMPKEKEVHHGRKVTYQFIVRNSNKGYMPDSYSVNVTSEHGFNLTYLTYVGTTNNPLAVYNESEEDPVEAIYNVTVHIPWYTHIESDQLIVNFTSQHSFYNQEVVYYKTVNITTDIINPNILEELYRGFESVAFDLGFDDALGDYAKYAGWLLIGIVFLIILIIVIPAIIIIRRKYVELICLDRIREITPNEKAEFEIDIQNPYKQTLTYDIKTEKNSNNKAWDTQLSTDHIIVEPGQSKRVSLSVIPTDYVKSDDWVEVKLQVNPMEKRKGKEISMVTSIKEGKADLRIVGVLHWPNVFKKGDKVKTSFRLRNSGNVAADNVTVILTVNGEEKNKVEGISIPIGGYADVEIPWIAEKGKNEVYIVVK